MCFAGTSWAPPTRSRPARTGYEQCKIGALRKQAREEAGLTQEQLARMLHTKKSAVSRIENHADDIKLSTLERFARALGKHLRIEVA